MMQTVNGKNILISKEAGEVQEVVRAYGRIIWLASGVAGQSATIDSILAVTLPAGSEATAENIGTNQNARFVFGIPEGNGIASIEKTGSTGDVDHYRIHYTNGGHFDYDVTNGEGSGGGTVWGQIAGTLSDQTDLQNALNAKADKSETYTKTEEDALFSAKADKTTTYTKTETDTLLSGKADKSATYTKTETDTLLNAKADKSGTYTKAEADALLNAKADKATTYTKTEADSLLAEKADTADLGTMAGVNDAPSNDKTYGRKNGGWAEITGGGGGGGATWGTITGSINDQTDLKNALDSKANSSSLGNLASKDSVDWDTDIDDIPSTFPPSVHTHDDRYYTETEINTALSAKANTADLGSLASKDSVDWDTDIEDIPATFPPSTHTHDDRYYTETEVDTALSGKANAADLGDLAGKDTVDYVTEVTNKPTIPNGALASLDSIDYTGNYLTNKPTLGGIQVRPDYTISTTDLTDGSSSLETGKLYFYYEA